MTAKPRQTAAAETAGPLAAAVLGAVPDPILAIGPDNEIEFANAAAETFFDAGTAVLCRRRLDDLVPPSSPILGLIAQVRKNGHSISEYGIELSSPKLGSRRVDLRVGPIMERDGSLVLVFQERSMARKIGDQFVHRGAARSVAGMAAVLAHEIKNPLSGVRGAAQLIEQRAGPEDRQLTRLICDEADRICALIDRMELFTDPRPSEGRPVNIHEVLDHVHRLAEAGFAAGMPIERDFDPSLPPVLGNRDQLIQIFLNLIKNAAEAVADIEGGAITLATAYRHGVRLEVPGSRARMSLPIEVTVTDNGPGVPEDLKPHLFEPFVSTRSGGTGLGLALVAKLVGDHGGIVECDSRPGKTVFRVLLAACKDRGAEASA